MKRLFDIDPWKVSTKMLNTENKRLQESITSLGNGYMGMRGNFEEYYSGDTHNGTYIAGVWYPDKTRVGWWKNGYPEYFGKVINAMNFIGVDIEVNGKKVDLHTANFRDFSLELNMRNGVLSRSYVLLGDTYEVKLSFERFTSIVTKELCAIEVKAEVLSGSVELKLTPYLDGDVTNEDSNYEEKFWLQLGGDTTPYSYLMTKTIPNNFEIPQFTVTGMMHSIVNDKLHHVQNKIETGYVQEVYEGTLKAGEIATLNKDVIIITSRDVEETHQVQTAQTLTEQVIKKDFETLKNENEKAWHDRWEKGDVIIKGDEAAQQAIRFNMFQLFSTYYGDDSRLNVGPKGFTGEKYGGATYWDTEAYIVPMFLSVADEHVTEQLLTYRHNQLPGAIHNAQQQGLKGALYPMVTFTGVECHNEWEITFEEIHRNAAIAHAIYNYTNYTGKTDYLYNEGLDVLVAISRFWADRVHYSKRAQKYMMHGVTGPNEYDNNVNNNWYTNTMAKWVLEYTAQSLKDAPENRMKELHVTQEELSKWADITENMYLPYDEELDVFVMHDTFLDKDLMPVSDLAPEDLPINQNWSWDKILRSCFIKQADVLQGMYFLNDQFTKEEKQKNYDFYEPMTIHESSLSPSIHAILAAELGMEDKAVEFYERTARLDLDNINNDTEDGLHITSLSGSWLSIVHGFGGMRTYNGILQFAPFCPENWDEYRFKVQYRGRTIAVSVTKDTVDITLLDGEPLEILLYGEKKILEKQ